MKHPIFFLIAGLFSFSCLLGIDHFEMRSTYHDSFQEPTNYPISLRITASEKAYPNHSYNYAHNDAPLNHNKTISYQLSKKEACYLASHHIQPTLFTNPILASEEHYELHNAFFTITQKAIGERLKRNSAGDLFDIVIESAALGLLATHNNQIQYATDIAQFCYALFDSACSIGKGVATGISNTATLFLHPINATRELAESVFLVARCAYTLIERAFQLTSIRSRDAFNAWKQEQTTDIDALYQIIKYQAAEFTPAQATQTLVAIGIETVLTGKLFGCLTKFIRRLNGSKQRIKQLAINACKPIPELVATTTEGVPVRISDELVALFH